MKIFNKYIKLLYKYLKRFDGRHLGPARVVAKQNVVRNSEDSPDY